MGFIVNRGRTEGPKRTSSGKKKKKKEKQNFWFCSAFLFFSLFVHDIRSALSQIARPAERATFRKKTNSVLPGYCTRLVSEDE